MHHISAVKESSSTSARVLEFIPQAQNWYTFSALPGAWA